MNPNSHQPRSLAVITGATGGVGLEVAKGLARAGYDIIVGARSERRGTEAVTAIRSVATDPASIQQSPLDLASLASVTAFASALPDRPIDRLVLEQSLAEGKQWARRRLAVRRDLDPVALDVGRVNRITD